MVNHGASCAAMQSDASAFPDVIDLSPPRFATNRLSKAAAVRLKVAVSLSELHLVLLISWLKVL